MISANQLYQVIEQRTKDDRSVLISKLFLEAMNDWPALNLNEPNEFIKKLKNEVGPSLTRNNLKLFSKRLNVIQDAWKIESLESIFMIFDLVEYQYLLQLDLEKILDLIIVAEEQS